MLDPQIESRVRSWLAPGFDEQVRGEINGLLEAGAWDELTDRFYQDLEFGTGGMRGVLGAGTNRMNEYVIRMTTQGLAEYVLEHGEGGLSGVIAHDSRHKSAEFALETALVLAANGIKAYLFPELRPTPELSFAVRRLGATVGVVVTASHNPPEYNGYKVYWSDGGQVVPPQDKGIIERVRRITGLGQVKWISREEAERKGLLEWLGPRIDEDFLSAVAGQAVLPEVVRRVAADFGVVYTPLHGTGATLVPQALERLGITRLDVLAEQREPDPEFSTVKSPNPEEKAALELAIARAEKTGASLVIGTDPDCDRMGIAYRRADGEFELVNGNQIGSLFCHYLLSRLKEKGALPPKPVIIKTIVTTELQRAIAGSFGVEVIDVLTGFKYIGEQIRLFEAEKDGRRFICGGEESYGYLVGTHARDKDAVVSSQMIAEIAAWCMDRGETLGDYLDSIYASYGVYLESLRSLTLKGIEGAQRIVRLMETFRHQAPEEISASRVVGSWDLASGQRTDLVSGQRTRTGLPSSNVLVFYLEDQGRVTMRPSGTEPKIKFYFGVVRPVGPGEDVAEAKQQAAGRLDRLAQDFMTLVEESLRQ
ncbi:MAG: phospho-sugar mutase [Candidatus Glassbacteria bacterium]|nr:phospho-sugar mutase [Candidatus Glassbacteria bacterium]